MGDARKLQSPGPFRTDQLRSGDPYELSEGHPVFCAPTGRDGAGPNGFGFSVLDSDPAVRNAGVDAGIAIGKNTLRAPDVAVNLEHDGGTWATSAPLVLEYAGRGQDEAELATKIAELLAAGTRWVWVMRLVGPRRVEVHAAASPVRVVNVDGELTAPGVLALPVPVRALFERDAAHETTLRNLLSARGYSSLEALRDKSREEGREEGLAPLVRLFERRLSRALTEAERETLRRRLVTSGPARLGDVVLDLGTAELAAWLVDGTEDVGRG
jgi:hypothetical protein